MATTRQTVDYIVEQMTGAGGVVARPMFGEFGFFCDGKMIAIIGEEQLFMKVTEAGRSLGDDAQEVSPYPGAKPYLRIDPDRWDDQNWMSELCRATTAEVPSPQPKPAKRRPS